MTTSTNIIAPSASLGQVWPKASDRRGVHVQLAIDYIKEFPIGTIASIDDFDQWAWNNGHLPKPASADKKSDGWQAHLLRRHQLRHKINMAGAHPRLASQGSTPFIMESVGHGKYEVREPHIAIAANRMDPRLKQGRLKLKYLMQSTDWAKLPESTRRFGEEIHYDVENYIDSVYRDTAKLNAKFGRYQGHIASLVKEGLIPATNDGVKQFLENKAEETDEQDLF